MPVADLSPTVYTPRSVSALLSRLKSNPTATLFAGGTHIMMGTRSKYPTLPMTLIHIKPIEELGRIHRTERYLEIGSCTSISTILKIGSNVIETISLNLMAVQQQAERLHRPILTHVNHPNWSDYDISPEDLAETSEARFFEVCNRHPGAKNPGDATHPSTEKLWDVANTLRIAKMKAPPLYGIAADDAHHYQRFASDRANPGRAWIMVRAKQLSADALLEAMNRGDFYASTGVILRDIIYNPKQRSITVEVEPEPDVSYTIEFIGTLKGVDPAGQLIEPVPGQGSKRPGRKYSPEVGKILTSVQDTSATYQLTGNELYVRPVVRSDKPIPNAPVGAVQLQEAWCQPVGWEH